MVLKYFFNKTNLKKSIPEWISLLKNVYKKTDIQQVCSKKYELFLVEFS